MPSCYNIAMHAASGPEALYIHVPFCTPSKCRYCDFFSEKISPSLEMQFLDGLRKEIALSSACVSPYTLFMGGGTPTALSPIILSEVLNSLALFDLSRLEEFSTEANPGTLTDEKLAILRNAGVNRISIGAQSFSQKVLSFLGRKHTPRDIRNSVIASRNAGVTNISLDLICDIPNTTPDDWRYDLEKAIECDIEHISAYSLSYEKSTPLWMAMQKGEFSPLDEDESAARMDFTREFLAANGFVHYEISNYSRPNKECKHNLIYWRNGQYLGLGPSAVSFVAGLRQRNVSNISEYSEALNSGRRPVRDAERLSSRAFAGETAMLMLRQRKGIDLLEFVSVTGMDFLSTYKGSFERLMAEGLLEFAGANVRIPDNKIPLSDLVAMEFLEDAE